MGTEPQEGAVLALVGEVRQRLEPRAGTKRAMNPKWTERDSVMFSRRTVRRLSLLASRVNEHGLRVEPMQIAELIVELIVELVVEEMAK